MMQETERDWPRAQWTKITPPYLRDWSGLGWRYLCTMRL